MADRYNKYSEETIQPASKGGDYSQYSSNTSNVGSDAVQAQPLEIKVYNGNFDKALRAFKSLVQKERILSLYKERQTYEKPSVCRRRKRNEAKRKMSEEEDEFKPRRTKEKSDKPE